jgi:hypothetical protein
MPAAGRSLNLPVARRNRSWRRRAPSRADQGRWGLRPRPMTGRRGSGEYAHASDAYPPKTLMAVLARVWSATTTSSVAAAWARAIPCRRSHRVEVLAADATDPVVARRASTGAAVMFRCANAPAPGWPTSHGGARQRGGTRHHRPGVQRLRAARAPVDRRPRPLPASAVRQAGSSPGRSGRVPHLHVRRRFRPGPVHARHPRRSARSGGMSRAPRR